MNSFGPASKLIAGAAGDALKVDDHDDDVVDVDRDCDGGHTDDVVDDENVGVVSIEFSIGSEVKEVW